MPNINIQKLLYRVRHQYLTVNNVIIAVAFFIAASWVWGSLGMMQRNYSLQKELDSKKQQLQLTELQKQTLEFQKKYYQTAEYQELAVRERLGTVRPGEKVLILPPNTVTDEKKTVAAAVRPQASNLEQWVNFLFGGYSRSIAEE
jgi:cell division protein FtsB